MEDDDASTASTKDELLEERRRRRGEMRDRRRKAMKDRKRAERDGTENKSSTSKKGGSGGVGQAPSLLVPSPKAASQSATSNEVSFSTLQFDDHGTKKKNKHALPSDPKAAIAVLEARKRKEESRQAKGDNSDAHDKADLARWGKAEAAAQGVRIRDDEALLRKAAKRREKQKQKSATAWKERQNDLESQQAARQKKRAENIAARKDKTKLKHQGKLKTSKNAGVRKSGKGTKAKHGIARPGFEGKRGPLGGGKKSSSGRKHK